MTKLAVLARPRRTRPTLGLALGAGGARGLAHVGVLRALEARGVRVDAVVGTSSGALVGAIWAAGQLEAFEQRLRGFARADMVSLVDPVWPRAGLISGSRVVEKLAAEVGDWRIEDLPVPFGAVAVDLASGEEVLIREGLVRDAIRASISIPGIFVPHVLGERTLVDGAIRNPVPVSHLEGLGVDVRVAVNLHREPIRELEAASACEDPAEGPRGSRAARVGMRLAETVDAGFGRLLRRRSDEGPDATPNLFETLMASMSVIEYELARHRLAHDPVDLVLEPDLRGIRAFEFHKADAAIEAGRSVVAERALELEARLALRRRRR